MGAAITSHNQSSPCLCLKASRGKVSWPPVQCFLWLGDQVFEAPESLSQNEDISCADPSCWPLTVNFELSSNAVQYSIKRRSRVRLDRTHGWDTSIFWHHSRKIDRHKRPKECSYTYSWLWEAPPHSDIDCYGQCRDAATLHDLQRQMEAETHTSIWCCGCCAWKKLNG